MSINWQSTLEYSATFSPEETRRVTGMFLKAGTSFAVVDGRLYMSKASYEVLCKGDTNGD